MTATFKGPLALAVIAFASAGLVAPAVAQDADEGSDEIIVTAQKREQRLQDVPLPVSAVTADQLESAGIASVTDLRFVAPSVNYGSSANTRGEGLQVRGVGTQIFGDGVEQSVGVVVDGVPMSRNGMGIADMVDVARIEVLRGPQGMLFGKNASAGLLNIITREPVLGENTLALSASYATLNDMRLAGTANMAFGDSAALRVTYQSRTRDGYIRNITRNEDLNDINNDSIRARFLAEVSPTLQFLIIGDYATSQTLCCSWTARSAPSATPFGALNAAAGIVPSPTNLRNAAGARFFQDQENYGLSLQSDWDMGWASLTTVSAYRYWFAEDNNDPDILPVNVLDRNAGDSTLDQVTFEARLDSPGNQPLEWTIGLFHLSMDNTGGNVQAGTLGLALPPGTTLGAERRSSTRNESSAIFGTVGYTFFDRLKLTAGARYTDESLTVDWSQVQASGATGTIPGRFYGTANAKRETDNVSWRVTAQYDVSDDIMVYLGAAEGYKGPAYDQGLVNATVVFTNPEIPTTLEAGLRAQFFERTTTLNLSLFSTTFEDFQAQVFDQNVFPSRFTTANAGELETSGFEFEFVTRPIEGLTISANGAHIDATYTDFKNVACYAGQTQLPFGTPRTSPRQCIRINSATGPFVTEGTGNPLTNSPELTGNVRIAYERDVGGLRGFGSVNAYYRDDVSFSVAGDPNLRQDAYTLLGAEFGLASQDDTWRVTVFGRNLTDESFANNIIPQPVLGAAGVYSQFPSADARQIVGVSLNVRFGD